jgi:hypothetical protein
VLPIKKIGSTHFRGLIMKTIVKESSGGEFRAEINNIGDDFVTNVFSPSGEIIKILEHKNSNQYIVETSVRQYLAGLEVLKG